MNPTFNLAVELPTEIGQMPAPAAAPDPRTALAAQFVPSGARVLDLSRANSGLEALLPSGCGYQGADLNSGEFPAQATLTNFARAAV
jgi:hypothetical protein